MTTNHHTPIATGANANAAIFNTPYSQLDKAISDIDFTYSGAPNEYLDGEGNFSIPVGTGGSIPGHVIQDEGTPLAQRNALNFLGAAITASNGTASTEVLVNGAVWYKNVETLTADKVLTDSDYPIQSLNPNGANRNITLPTAGAGNALYVFNNTSAADNLVLTDGTAFGTITPLKSAFAISDGSDWYTIGVSSGITDAPSDSTAYGRKNAAWVNVTEEALSNGTTFGRKNATWEKVLNATDDLLDEDDMVSDSNTKAATQQSIKAYVDNNKRAKNFIINGAMQISQRGTSENGITTAGYKKAPDRFYFELNSLGTWTASQDSDAPDGFGSSYKLLCTVANASPAAAANVVLRQYVEGQNLQQLKKGRSDALDVTVSFWIKSNNAGTYIAELEDVDNTRSISSSFTVDSADTWEKKEVTFAGDTTGALDNDNNKSLSLNIWLDAGSQWTSGSLQTSWGAVVNANRAVGVSHLGDTTSNYVNITGVQLEAGDSATEFEHLLINEDLLNCQRYYQKSYNYADVPGTIGVSEGISAVVMPDVQGRATVHYRERMRSDTTVITYNYTTGNSGVIRDGATASDVSASVMVPCETGYYLNWTSIANREYLWQWTAESEL